MALPGVIGPLSSYDSPQGGSQQQNPSASRTTYNGPFESSTGDLFYFFWSTSTVNSLHAFRSTDGGETWASWDSILVGNANTSNTRADDVYFSQSGDTVHAALSWILLDGMGGSNYQAMYLQFSMSTGFGTHTDVHTGFNGQSNGSFVCERGNGDIVFLYSGPPASVMGSDYARPHWAVSSNGGTSWTLQGTAVSATRDAVEMFYYPRGICASETDVGIVHFYLGIADTNPFLVHTAANASNVMGGELDLGPSYLSRAHSRPVSDGTDCAIVSLETTPTPQPLHLVTHADAYEPATFTRYTDTDLGLGNAGDDLTGWSLTTYDGAFYFLFSKDSVSYGSYTTDESGSWVVSDTLSDSVNDAHRTTDGVGYVTTDSTDWYFDELVLAAPPPLLAVADSSHSHVSDEVTLTEHPVFSVVPNDSTHAHTSGEVNVGTATVNDPFGAPPLVITLPGELWDTGDPDTTFTFTVSKGDFEVSDDFTVGHITLVAVESSTHAHTSDPVDVVGETQGTLSIKKSVHEHSSEEVVVTVQYSLLIADANHGHASEEVVVIETVPLLQVGSAFHGHTSDSLEVYSDLVGVQDSAHAHSSGEAVLTEYFLVAPQGAIHTMTSDEAVATHPFIVDRETIVVGGKRRRSDFYRAR